MSEIRNVLVIMADQLRADHVGFGGGAARTPHLDQLARSSMVFDRAHVANPTCMPNRASILTGRWPTAHGTSTNGITLDPDAETFPRTMRRAGYRTAAVGKLHLQTMGWDYEHDQLTEILERTPETVDPEIRDAVSPTREPGWDSWENRSRHDDEHLPLPADYYGFDSVDLVVGHGDHPGGHYVHWARERGYDPRSHEAPCPEVEFSDWPQVYRSDLPVELHPTSYIAERAIEHVRLNAEHDNPFLLTVSFPDPHHPFAPPGEYWGMYRPDEVPLPATFDDAHERSPEHIRAMVAECGRPGSDPTVSWSPTEHQLRTALAAEFGLITMLDAAVGRILDELQARGLADETAVVFTSDHGDLFGDHGLMLKHFVHYEAVTRVPLLIHLPGMTPGRTDALVSSADIAPTLLRLTGLPRHRGIQGKDLTGIIEGSVDRVRDALLIEEDLPFGTTGLPGPVRMRTLINDEARLTRYAGAEISELYDLRRDPDERSNIADTAHGARLQARMFCRLADELAVLGDVGVRPVASA